MRHEANYSLTRRGGPVIVMGGAEHGPVMLRIVPEFQFMYEDFGAVKAAARSKQGRDS